MYARVLTIKTKPGKRAEVEALADQAFGFMKSLQGFVSAYFLAADDENEYGSMSFWESIEDAEAAGEALNPHGSSALQELVSEPLRVIIYEVYNPQ